MPATADPAVNEALALKLGLSPVEWRTALDLLDGRTPSYPELGIFSAMWSEHCSYKSSRIHLKNLPTEGPRVIQGPGENAGVVDIGDGWAVAFKMESHNHPSYIEPYQGAATGVGGILRDVFTMGARPLANLNSLRFGELDAPRMKALVKGVAAGISGYGNCMGIPMLGGDAAFDPCYNGNILVNAFTLGVLRADNVFTGYASGVGNKVMYIGSKTGRDGIHGASMASSEFGEGSEEKRPTVQVGDPFTEKLLLEACLEIFQTDWVIGIQDMGAAGLTSSSFEMASRAGTGLALDLDRIPMREEGMTPFELMLSESQERMLLVARPGHEAGIQRILHKWDLDAVIVGEVTGSGRFIGLWHGAEVINLPIQPLADAAPKYDRPQSRPAYLDEAARRPMPADLGPEEVDAQPAPAPGQPHHRQQALDLRAVRRHRAGQHPAAPGRGGRRPDPGQGHRQGHRHEERLQQPLRLPGSLLGRRPRRGRSLPQPRLRRRRADRPHRLPQLRQPGEPREHVGPGPGHPGHPPGLPGPRRPHRQRQREPVQRHRRRRDLPHAHDRRRRADRGLRPGRRGQPLLRVVLPRTRPRRLPAGRDPGRTGRQRVPSNRAPARSPAPAPNCAWTTNCACRPAFARASAWGSCAAPTIPAKAACWWPCWSPPSAPAWAAGWS